MKAYDYIEDLASRGSYHVTVEDVRFALGGGDAAVREQIRRLKKRGLIAEPTRGFLVVVPHEYRQLGCLPPEQFVPQLMALKDEPYYFCLLTAAQQYGAAHQRPQASQVMVRKNRQPIECGKVRVEFVARRDLERMPVFETNTPRGVARFAAPEVTALELVGYPNRAGGLNNVATVLSDLAEELDPKRLVAVAKMSPTSWSQRLGYLLEYLDRADLAQALEPFVDQQARNYTPLRRAAGTAGRRMPSWKVIANVEIDPDL